MGVEDPVADYWYVLRDLARSNSKNPAYKVLQARSDMQDCVFVPMKQQVFKEFGRRVVRLVPYMSDLLFVHKSREELEPIVQQINGLQFRYVRGGKQYEALAVRHDAMQRFIKAVEQTEVVLYYAFDEVSPQLYGKKIRIIGGRLNGLTGRLMSKRGSKVKRLIIDLEECRLSAAIQVESEYIQLVK